MNVPIIGQPVVHDYCITLLVRCSCNHELMLIGQLGAERQCAECGKVYQMASMPTIDLATHQLNVTLGISIPTLREKV